MSDEQLKQLITHGIYIMFNGSSAKSTTYHIQEMMDAGIEDPIMFIKGYKDAISDNGFNESDISYIQGFKYGVTGIIDITNKKDG